MIPTWWDVYRYLRGLMPGQNAKDLLQRCVEKIAFDESGCWLWQGAYRTGYGAIYVSRGVIGVAHRVLYELLVEPIPADLQLDHLCRVRSCVNPDHLEPVTQRENILRGEASSAIRARQTHCVRGHLFDGANTYIRSDGWRQCRACHAYRDRAYRAKSRSRDEVPA